MERDNTSIPNHLEPSPLGTKEYWDSLYSTELSNHAVDPTDEGTIWFDDASAEAKVTTFLNSQILERKILHPTISRQNCSVLDLGAGNGHFLFRLHHGEGDSEDDAIGAEGEGCWTGRLMGVDYSAKSVEFARRIAAHKKAGVEFRHWDIMTDSPALVLDGNNTAGWDVVLDKGTFDAISLSEEKDALGRRICEGYKERVVPLVREGGVFLITSCNWTGEELGKWFGGEEGGLEEIGRVVYKSFSFGGRVGQSVSTVCFRKKGLS